MLIRVFILNCKIANICRTLLLARYAVVCLSVISRYGIEMTGHIELFFFGEEAFLYLRPTLCCREIWVPPKVRVLPLELCPELRKKFQHDKSIVSSAILVDGRVC